MLCVITVTSCPCLLLWVVASVNCFYTAALHHAATDGENGEEGDEEQGGGNGKQKSGSDKKPHKESERGMLKSPGNRQQMRSRAHTPSDGHQENIYTPQQYQPGFVDESPMDGHPAYTMGNGELTRFPSINMDWQTLRASR